MYKSYFGFREKPFKLVPNPVYLFLSKSHEIALAHLTYATDQGEGFVVIIGEVGTGKTTLCRNYLEGLGDRTSSAYIFNPRLDASQLLGSICAEFGIVTEANRIKDLLDLLNQYLIAQNAAGRRVVLLIDEAQGLSIENLELVRMLSNLETTRSKLLQIILVGQPELGETLDSYDMRQLAQRISLIYHLAPLSPRETEAYIYHRLRVAADRQTVHFSADACRGAYQYSKGIPRLINIVCDRALLLAFSNNHPKVTNSIMQAAIRELMSRGQVRQAGRKWSYLVAGATLLLVAAVSLALFVWQNHLEDHDRSAAAAPSTTFVAPVPTPPATPHKVPPPGESSVSADVAETPPATRIAETNEASSRTEEVPEEPVRISPESALTDRQPSGGAPLIDGTVREAFPPPNDVRRTAAESMPTESIPAKKTAIKEVLASLDPHRSRKDAVKALLTLWQQPQPNPDLLPEQLEDGTFYDLAARQYGLRALEAQWDWGLLQRLNLPVIVALQPTGAGPVVYLTIVGISQGGVRLADGDSPAVIEIELSELNSHIAGPMYVFWRNSIGFDMLIGRGANRSAVLGIKHMLRQLGYPEVPLTPVFDTYTEDVVKAFQARHQLAPDGLVGPLTKIMLLRETDTERMPLLVKPQEG